MARHELCPSTMTVENLADWIRSNRVDSHNHTEKFPLTDDEKKELALKSSSAGQAISRLKKLQDYVNKLIKKGTPWETSRGENGDHRPVDVTVPPTAGIDVLEANRQYADDQIEKGYREEITTIYMMPWPEYEKMVAIDIEGNEWSNYSRMMTKDEVRQHGKPILSAAQELRENLAEAGIKIDRVEGNVVHMSTDETVRKGKKGKEQPRLSDDEQRELDGEEELNL